LTSAEGLHEKHARLDVLPAVSLVALVLAYALAAPFAGFSCTDSQYLPPEPLELVGMEWGGQVPFYCLLGLSAVLVPVVTRALLTRGGLLVPAGLWPTRGRWADYFVALSQLAGMALALTVAGATHLTLVVAFWSVLMLLPLGMWLQHRARNVPPGTPALGYRQILPFILFLVLAGWGTGLVLAILVNLLMGGHAGFLETPHPGRFAAT
jgi:hypothetical protein